MTTAIIGGTGLAQLSGLHIFREHAVATPYGATSAAIQEGVIEDSGHGAASVFFLHRHGGSGMPIPPHLVNYRANLWALRELGVERVVAANAVGSIARSLKPGSLVIPNQLIDYTWGREHSFDDGSSGSLMHVDFTDPFSPELREALLAAGRDAQVGCIDGGVLAVVQGPRLETTAEVRRLDRDGCDLVGMTSMPEAGLARELALAYASVCMIVNAAAGIEDEPISLDAIRTTLAEETQLFAALVRAFISS